MTSHGNYKGYSGHLRASGTHLASHLHDSRLTQLHTHFPTLFPTHRILDIGCNNGSLTVSLARPPFSAASVHGLDIDAALIHSAKSHLSFVFSRRNNYFPVSSVLDHGHIPYPPEADTPGAWPRNVTFQIGDVLKTAEVGGGRYDVVLALSVVKWVHIQHGDQGLFEFWARVGRLLDVGGRFVLEPQEWASYERAVKKNPRLRAKVAELKVRPESEEFVGRLLAVGFVVEGRVQGEGKRRDMWVFRRIGDTDVDMGG